MGLFMMDDQKNTMIALLGKYCVENNLKLEDLQSLNLALKDKEEKISDDMIHMNKYVEIKDKVLKSGDLLVNFKKKLVLKEGRLVIVHDHELLILRLLIANPKDYISDQEILRVLQINGHEVTQRSMVVYVSRLSKSLGLSPIGEKYIRRKSKRGYFWNSWVQVQ